MSAPDFYDCDEDSESLRHETVDEAVEFFLDSCNPSDWPTTLAVYAWTTQTIGPATREWMGRRVAEHFWDDVFEEYRNPEESSSSELDQIATNFVTAALEQIRVWACDRAGEHDEAVNVAAWVRENEPSWIDDNPEIAAWCAARPS